MKELLNKIKNLDEKIIIGAGIGMAIVVVLVISLVIGGKPVPDSDITDSNSQNITESEDVKDSLQSENTEIQNSQMQESESQSTEIKETETQETETQGSSESVKEPESEIITPPTPPQTEQTPPQTEQAPPPTEQVPPAVEETEKDETQIPSEPETPLVTESYNVNVVSAGGHKMYNVKVHAYTDQAMTNLFTTAATNSKGIATLELEQGKEYFISLSNVPEGYKLSPSYSLVGETTSIVLESSVVTGKEFPSKKLKVGNVMYDFTVPSANGGEIKLSEVIHTKELVVLNFWYVNCQFCVMEFPYMSNAYNIYKDKVEIIALNPFDNMDAVQNFLTQNPLPFQVATCDTSIPNLFGIDAYPVSVIIDKYGVIREIEKGAILQESGFINLFNKYL